MRMISSLLRFIQKIFHYIAHERIFPVFQVFARDVKTIFSTGSSFLIILGLCCLPSLYAWVNIYACWDPYANTGNLPIAIVNNDEGDVFNGNYLNVGNRVVEILEDNETINWDFVDDWHGNYGLYEGTYYAMIEIPRNFTSGLITMTTPTPQKPVITYKLNEKLNAIASKIATAAQTKLVKNIESNFVKTVSDEAIEALKLETEKFDLNSTLISEIEATFQDANTDISQLKQYLSDTSGKAKTFQAFMNQSPATFEKLREQIETLQQITQANRSLANQTKQTMQSISSDLNHDVNQLQEINTLNQDLLTQLQEINSNTMKDDLIGIMEETKDICYSMDIIVKADRDNIKSLNKSFNLSTLRYLASTLDYMHVLLGNEVEALDELIPLIYADDSQQAVDAALNTLSKISDEMSTKIQTLSDAFYTQSSPLLTQLVQNMDNQMQSTDSILDLTKNIVPQLNALAVFGSASSQQAIQQANTLTQRLDEIQLKINDLLETMDKIQDSEDLDHLIDLFETHQSDISDFISSPVEVQKIDVFETTTFGEGLTPFYTVLAIWVGVLLSCALISVESKDEIKGKRLNLKQRHFGKMLLFLAISFIQSTIIVLGDVYLLGVKPASWSLMFQTSMLCSVTFVVIIFSLVSVFGNVGKGMAAVIMVLQIAGSGGIYPVQTNPEIFGQLQFLWPFTYAISAFREAIAGPIPSSVEYNFRSLFLFILAFFFLASLKKPLHKLNIAMQRKYKEAGI